MRVYDYEYEEPEYEGYISDERKKELISYIKSNYYKKDNTIPLHLILKKTEDNNEYIFMYNWLKENNIIIRGMNGTLTRNVFNYEEIVIKSKKEVGIIPVEEQLEYFEKIANRDKKARHEFIEKNIRLADWVANSPGINRLNIPSEDKTSYAYQGLIKAVDGFDAKKTYIDKNGVEQHYKFSTYATKCIYFTIIREFHENNKNSLVNIPIYALEQLDILTDIENNFLVSGIEPNPKDIADIMGIKEERVEQLKKYKHIYDFESLDAVEEEINTDSVVDRIGDTEKIQETLGGYVLDGVYYEPERGNVGGLSFKQAVDENEDLIGMVNTSLLASSLNEVLNTLTDREAKVLKLRCGLEDGEAKTLEEVAKRFDVTKERIRQIEAKALRKFRHPSRSNKILGFVDCEFAHRYTSSGLSAIISERKLNMVPKEEIISDNGKDLNLSDDAKNFNDLDSKDIFADEFENPVSDFIEVENVESEITQEENPQEIIDGDLAEKEMSLDEKLALAIHNLENAYLELDENIKINEQKVVELRKKLSELNLSTLSVEAKIKKVEEILSGCDMDDLKDSVEIQNLMERKRRFEEELKRKQEEEKKVSTDLKNTESNNQMLKEQQNEIMNKIDDTIQEI